GIRDKLVTGVQTCALPISGAGRRRVGPSRARGRSPRAADVRYEVALAGRALRVDLSSDGRFAVDGQAVAADAREVVRGRQWSVVLDGRSHEVTLVTYEPLRLDVDGVDVEVSVV